MRRRLYYMLPSVTHARAMLDELLLARIEERHLHFMARDGSLPPGIPDASVLQKTDVVHGLQLGVLIGGLAGLGAGVFLALFPPDGLTMRTVSILVATLGGAIFGAWASGMNAAALPNTRLAQFAERIARGQVLLIVDVAPRKAREVETMMTRRHPEVSFGGAEPPMLAFP